MSLKEVFSVVNAEKAKLEGELEQLRGTLAQVTELREQNETLKAQFEDEKKRFVSCGLGYGRILTTYSMDTSGSVLSKLNFGVV